MAKVRAEAALSMRIGLAHKKGFGSHDGATPHHSVSIERENLSDDLTDEELAEKAEALHGICRRIVEKKINADREDLQKVDN